jgi:hypothetical protein
MHVQDFAMSNKLQLAILKASDPQKLKKKKNGQQAFMCLQTLSIFKSPVI